jgi:hypothetical protein
MLEYDLTFGPEEVNTLCKLVLGTRSVRKSQRPIKILSVIFGIASLLLSILYITHDEKRYGSFLLGVSIAFFFLAIRGIYLIQVRAVKRNLKREHAELLQATRHYTLDETGVRLSSQYGTSENPWSAFRRWGTIDHYVYLQRVDTGNLLFDQNKLSASQKEELFRLLSSLPREDRS